MIQEQMAKYLRDFAQHIRSDDANTDEFLVEGMDFMDCVELMNHVATAVDEYVARNAKK